MQAKPGLGFSWLLGEAAALKQSKPDREAHHLRFMRVRDLTLENFVQAEEKLEALKHESSPGCCRVDRVVQGLIRTSLGFHCPGTEAQHADLAPQCCGAPAGFRQRGSEGHKPWEVLACWQEMLRMLRS